MAGKPNRQLERRIIEVLEEWSPQHLTADEVALIIGTSSRSSILSIAKRLASQGRVRVEPHSHYGLDHRRPARRIYAR